MRVFIALELPDRVKNEMKEIQRVFEGYGDINFTNDFHSTLKFLGEISPTKLERVKERLKTIEFKPFELHLNKLGVFPSRHVVEVLWVGVEPQNKIKKLQERIESKLMDMFKADKQFTGHITLGKVKNLDDQNDFLGRFREIKPEGSFKVKNFCLMQIEMTSQGPIYTILERYGF